MKPRIKAMTDRGDVSAASRRSETPSRVANKPTRKTTGDKRFGVDCLLPILAGTVIFFNCVLLLWNDFRGRLEVFSPPPPELDTRGRLTYTTQWSLLLLTPFVFASVIRSFHKCNVVDAWLMTSLDVTLQLLVNVVVLTTYATYSQLSMIPPLIVTTVIFRFLHYFAMSNGFTQLKTGALGATSMANIVFFCVNFYYLFGDSMAALVVPPTDSNQPPPPEGGWFF